MKPRPPDTEHALRNQVAIVVGYCELLLHEIPPGNPLHADLVEMHRAAVAAMDLLAAEGSNP